MKLQRLTIALPDSTVGLLKKLLATGLYGITVEAVVERLVSQQLIDKHVIKPRFKIKGS